MAALHELQARLEDQEIREVLLDKMASLKGCEMCSSLAAFLRGDATREKARVRAQIALLGEPAPTPAPGPEAGSEPSPGDGPGIVPG